MTSFGGQTRLTGEVSFRRPGAHDGKVQRAPLRWRAENYVKHRLTQDLRLGLARAMRVQHFYGSLRMRVHHADGTVTDYGVVSKKLVTTVGVGFIVDAFQNLVEVENMKFHGFGTGGAAEAVGNTALTTELTTQYVVDNTRPTGSTTEGAGANVYRSVGTLDPDAAVAITEHGIFSASSAGTLLDRSLFSVINVAASGDTLEATYDLTFADGG